MHVISNIDKVNEAGTHQGKHSHKIHLSTHFLFLSLPVSGKHIRKVMCNSVLVPGLLLLIQAREQKKKKTFCMNKKLHFVKAMETLTKTPGRGQKEFCAPKYSVPE